MLSTFSRILSVHCLLIWPLFFSSTNADVSTRVGNHTIQKTVNLIPHSLYAPYIDQDLQNRWWDFGADAYINTNKYVRLTQNRQSQMGWLWSRTPMTAGNFIIETEFKVSGHSTHLYGDGLALWLTKERTESGPVFGNRDKFNGLAIIIDTYANGRHAYSFPRISAFLNDGTTSYEFGNDGEEQAIGACSANIRRTNVATKLKVTYVKGELLDVKIQHKAWDLWSDCFQVENITLPPSPFLGFSALTGQVSDAHDIISVTSSVVYLSDATSPRDKKKNKSGSRGAVGSSRKSDSSSESTWFGFFFKFILFVGLVAGGVYGWKEYQRRQRYGGFAAVGGGGGGGHYARGGGGGMMMGPRFGGPYANEKRF